MPVSLKITFPEDAPYIGVTPSKDCPYRLGELMYRPQVTTDRLGLTVLSAPAQISASVLSKPPMPDTPSFKHGRLVRKTDGVADTLGF
jgi:hypothetical protein